MSSDALKVLEDALKLPEQERADVAARLIESLDPKGDTDVEAAWDAEIQRRIKELESGSVRTIPWPEARRIIVGDADAHARRRPGYWRARARS
jgi:putative addiction module component (TIGR02574 family)